MTEAEARQTLLEVRGFEAIALAQLVRYLDPDVLVDLASHVREACAVSETYREQHCVVDLRARRGRVHDALMSQPRLSSRRRIA